MPPSRGLKKPKISEGGLLFLTDTCRQLHLSFNERFPVPVWLDKA
jgi:hypothetical protein